MHGKHLPPPSLSIPPHCCKASSFLLHLCHPISSMVFHVEIQKVGTWCKFSSPLSQVHRLFLPIVLQTSVAKGPCPPCLSKEPQPSGWDKFWMAEMIIHPTKYSYSYHEFHLVSGYKNKQSLSTENNQIKEPGNNK
jgi:hypothetical protein